MAFSFRMGTNWCHDFPKLAKESGFHFNTHRSKVRIDWNRMCTIDIDQVIKERDFSVVDENINNVIDYYLESEYDIKILDANFVKLFRLAQLAVEYLLYCKQYLDHSVVILKDELKLKIENNIKLKKEIESLEEVIKHFKNKSRSKIKLIETPIADSNGEIYKCPHCTKTFVSIVFVNAHVARRHSYITDFSATSSPVHEHYRAETEKLHSEIKMLKERLNQTEKVIRSETDKIDDAVIINSNKKESKNSQENFKSNMNKCMTIEKEEKKNEETNELKNVLFDEIRNFMQRERSPPLKLHEKLSEVNVKTLISIQEKEIDRLQNQLLEKLTPDIENMHIKLQTQEQHWKSKMEHMEYQHRMDIEKLTAELKLMQQTADFMKSEYELKVNTLEKQSRNQSTILTEQSKQLDSLSREISSSQMQIDGYKYAEDHNTENLCSHIQMSEHQGVNAINGTNSMINVENEKITVEDVNSISSQDSTSKSMMISQYLRKQPSSITTMQCKTICNKQNAERIKVKQQSKCQNKVCHSFENNKHEINTKNNQNHKKKFSDTYRTLNLENILEKSNNKKQNQKLIEKSVVQRPLTNFEAKETSSVFTNSDTNSSETLSDTISKSKTEIEIKDVNTAEEKLQVNRNENFPQLELENIYQKNIIYPKLREDAVEKFEKKLKDLGIDPTWEGIPHATFQQKMEFIHHHQHLNSKKLLKYNEIKRKIVEEILYRISTNYKVSQKYKSIKTSLLDKFMTNVKSKAIKAFSIPKSFAKEFDVKYEKEIPNRIVYNTRSVSKKSRILSTERSKLEENSMLEKSIKQVRRKSNPEIKFRYKNKIISNLMESDDDLKKMLDMYQNTKNKTEEIQHSSADVVPVLDITKYKTSTPKKGDISLNIDEMNESRDFTLPHKEIHNIGLSPKNKSVLKFTTGSVGSLVKKKVYFDLENEKEKRELSPHILRKKQLSDSDWNISSIPNEGEFQTEKSISADIMLRTMQTEKIAQISKKIEEQLNLSRRKPMGAIETMFSSAFISQKVVDSESNCNIKEAEPSQLSPITIASAISDKVIEESSMKSSTINQLFPQPVPRGFMKTELASLKSKNELFFSKDSNLDSDIDEILRAE